ncbi:MAG TPA: hypothetical protein VGN46_09175 [Luteibacter sp.]|jgi:hypothetical protein|uniref:hypothetical protein n=1 Tax=Luteibacter sp. TaxID=1886636 RepID=UPI002F3E6479
MPSYDLKLAWLKRMPRVGDTLTVGMMAMADLIEETDGLLSELQAALAELIKEGIVENAHAKRPRPVNAVNFRKDGTLRRLKIA